MSFSRVFSRSNASSQRGLTLVELMVTVAIMAILLGVGVPSFQSFVQNSRATAQANEFLTAMSLARSESLKRARPVSICGTTNNQTCNGTWQDGLLVFRDGNAAGSTTANVSEVLRVVAKANAVSVDSRLTDGGGTVPTFIRYLPSGAVDLAVLNKKLIFKLKPDGCEAQNARELTLALSGSASVAKASCTP